MFSKEMHVYISIFLIHLLKYIEVRFWNLDNEDAPTRERERERERESTRNIILTLSFSMSISSVQF